MGFSTKPELVPLDVGGSAMPWLACPYGGGGTQCKGLLSQQMASQVGQNHPKLEGGKVVSAVVMPPQAHRELQGKQNKTKLIGIALSTCVELHWFFVAEPKHL